MATQLRVLTADDVSAALPMAEAIAAVRGAFSQLAAGQAFVPLRTQLPGDGGTALMMPAYLPADHGLGAKIVSVFPNNPARGLPTVTALVVLLEADTGRPVALLDGTRLTALRTGAASGLATDLLAPPGADTLALFGAGAQARTQLLAICTVRRIRTVWVYDAAPGRAQELIAGMAGRQPIPADLRAASTAAEATRSACILATATTSLAPVFCDTDLLPGAHINAIGAFTPQMQEVPPETVGRARVFVDQVGPVMAEAGDLIRAHGQGLLDPARLVEIGAVVLGQAVGRQSPEQITLFKSVGVAVQDIAAATRALRIAEERGLGTMVTL